MQPKVLPNQGSQDGREAVVAAIMACTKRAPFVGRTFSGLRLFFDPTHPWVASTNGRELRVNPDTMLKYEPAERTAIMAHEALHVICRHSERLTKSAGFPDHEKANVAADYAINGWLLGQGFEVPADGYYDPAFDGMGAREIYHRLPDNVKQQQPQWGRFEPGACVEDPPDVISTDAQAAGLEELLHTELGIEPKSSRLSLDRIMSRLLITDPVWQRDYRRPHRSDANLPSWVERDERPRTVVGLDISGSIRQEVREVFLGVLSRVVVPVTVAACDVRILPTHIWRDVSINNHKKLCAEMPRKGGGTRFQPVIDFAAHERANLVYLTDGENGYELLDRKGVPITWLIWGQSPNPALCQFGKVIMVET